MKKSVNSIILGVLIITLGIVFLGNNLQWWSINIFFKGWWTLFIIIPSITGLFKKESVLSSLLGLSIGVLLLLAIYDIIVWQMVGKMFIPVLLMIIGFSMIWSPKKVSKEKKKIENQKEYIAVFSSCEDKIINKFTGTSCVCVFGGIRLDLRNAKIEEDIIISCVSIFGGIDLLIPDNVKVEINGVPVFGGVENKALQKEEKYTIYINYVTVFGGVDIK